MSKIFSRHAGSEHASTGQEGTIRIATVAEALAGTEKFAAITPEVLQAKITELIGAAPEALDTLNEIAAAINDDANFFTTVNAQVTNLQDQINSLSGGGASNQAEVDRIEAGVGLGSTGLYVSRSGTNFLDSASSIVGEITALDTQAKTNKDDIAAIDTRLTTGEGEIDTLQTESIDYESRIASLEGTSSNQAEVDAIEASVGLNANGTLGSYANNNFYSASATIKAAVAGVDAQAKLNKDDITAHNVRITSLESGGSLSALQSEVDASQAAVGLSTAGAYVSRSGSNYLDSASTIVAEIGLLDAQVDTNEQDIATINTTISTLTSEGDSNGDAIDALQIELDATQAGAGLSNLGAYTAPGVSNYLTSASTLKAADSLLDTQIKTNETAIGLRATEADLTTAEGNISTNTANISSNDTEIQALEDLADTHEASIGLNANGSYTAISGANFATSSTLKGAVQQLDTQLNTTQGDLDTAEATIVSNTSAITSNDTDIATLNTLQTTQEAAIGLSTAGAYVNRSGSNFLDSASSIVGEITALDTEIATNAGDILGNANQITAQIALNNTQETAIGLSATGTYVSRSGTNYLDSASSIVGEITALDTAVDGLQTEVNLTQTGAGLNANGTYSANTGSNYIISATSLTNADDKLDEQIKINEDNIALRATSVTVAALQTEADNIETGVGLNANGTFNAFSGSNFLDATSTIKGAIEALDAQVKTKSDELDTEEAARASADSTLTSAIDTVEASVGLDANGGLTISGTNFIDGQSTLLAATKVLDTNINLIDQIQDNIRASAGLSSTGTKTNYSSTNIIANANSLKAAIEALDVQVNTNATDITSISGGSISTLQTEVNSIETAAGLDTDGTYVAHSGSNYMDSASTMKAAREALDTQVKTNETAIATKTNATTTSALDLRVTQLEISGGGILLDHASDDAVEFDNTISRFKSHIGPFEISLSDLVRGPWPGTTDLIFYGTKAERDGDRHFAVHPTTGDAFFTGKFAG